MNKNFSKDKGNRFSDKGNRRDQHSAKSFKEFITAERSEIDKINIEHKGKSFILTGVIDRVMQTGGPTVFYISDGTGTLALKAFEKAGVRAFPHLDVGHVIEATVTIGEYEDALEGEISKAGKISDQAAAEFHKRVEILERKRAEIKFESFLVKSPILDKLKDLMVKAAIEVRLAVIQNRPIVIRHHNDADGYSSGLALERAILPLIVKQHTSTKAAWEFYTRAPCNAPMYEIDDSIRDTAHSLAHAAKFSNKMPLILIVDTGSGEEDLLGIQQGRVHGIDFIVVDHHRFEKDLITKEALAHINPFLVGEDGAKYSAGMLCTELAHLINPVDTILQIPAMAGMADRIDNPSVMKEYIKYAAEKGYNEALLADIATVIDFVSAKLRFMEAREYIEVLFGEPMEKQKALVALLAPYIRNLEAKGLTIARAGATTEKIGKTTVQSLEVEQNFPRGFYPKPGKVTGLVHDDLQVKKKIDNVVTLGIMPDAVTIRATDAANFSVQEMILFLNKKLPEAFVEGGGHKNAGSIKFLPAKKEKIVELIKEFIKGR